MLKKLCRLINNIVGYIKMINQKMAKVVTKTFTIEHERPLFQVLFLKDDKNGSVEVEETNEVDFQKVRDHLRNGEAVFITRRLGRRSSNSLISKHSAISSSRIAHTRGKDGRRAS